MDADTTARILSIIADKYDLDLEDLTNLVALEMRLPKTKSNVSCHAYVKGNNGVCQCTKAKHTGDFCAAHSVKFSQGTLPYGHVNGSYIQTEKINVNNCEYLYHSTTQRIYSATDKVPCFLGFLTINGDVIKIKATRPVVLDEANH